MEKTILNAQDVWRDINEYGSKTLELLRGAMADDAIIRLDMNDLEKALSCDGQMVIIKAEADNLETALRNLFTNSPFDKEDIIKAKRLLLAITIKTDDNLLLKEMDYLRDFIGGFKECTFDTWGLYKDANQTHNVSIICWAVGV